MTSFVKNGNDFDLIQDGNMDLHAVLPPGTYSVSSAPMRGYYLTKVPDVKVNNKIYGNVEKKADRILNTFYSRQQSTGVLLSGLKGTGKTMLSKRLCEKAREERGVVTILINEPHRGEAFNRFISSINQPTIIIFDEFEKVYQEESQEELLTLFDGVYPSQKLFLITTNAEYAISEFLLGRPGRIFYKFDYGSLPKEEIREYLEDNMVDKSKVGNVLKATVLIKNVSYDILKALCEDVNRYPDDKVSEVLDYLNIEKSTSQYHYKVKSITNYPGVAVGTYVCNENVFNPFRSFMYVLTEEDREKRKKKSEERTKSYKEAVKALRAGGLKEPVEVEEEEEKMTYFSPDMIVDFDDESVTYQNGDVTITIEKADPPTSGRNFYQAL